MLIYSHHIYINTVSFYHAPFDAFASMSIVQTLPNR